MTYYSGKQDAEWSAGLETCRSSRTSGFHPTVSERLP